MRALSLITLLLLAVLTGCASDSSEQETGSTDSPAPYAVVEVAQGAYIDADPNGGDEITGEVTLGEKALCFNVDRVGVEVVGSFPDRTVENWTNAGDIPLAFVFPDNVTVTQGDLYDLPVCVDELHGYHEHQDH